MMLNQAFTNERENEMQSEELFEKQTLKEIPPEKTIRRHRRWDNPKVSVIVPVYKVDKYLTKCLESIVNQTLEEIEIIIVDEGEQDRCREIIDYYESQDPRIIAPHQRNGGYGASCNLGIRLARGEYISIIESDDFIEPEMYEEMYNYAVALDADVVKTPFRVVGDFGSREYEYRKYQAEHLPRNKLFSAKEFNTILRFHGAIWSAIYRRSYIVGNNIFFITERGGAYVDIVFRYDTLTQTKKIAWIDRTYYNYHVDENPDNEEQHNNHNITGFLNRWAEVHQRLDREPDECKLQYGSVLLWDEVGDTLSKLSFVPFTQDEIQILYNNLSKYNDDIVQAAMSLEGYKLEKYKKRLLKEFLVNPVKVYKKKRRIEKIAKIYKAKKALIDQLLNTIINPILLFWLFVGFCTTSIVIYLLDYFNCANNGLNVVVRIILISFLLGIIGCFLTKIVRKLFLWIKFMIQW